jgi:hypothetical protein
MTSEPSIFSYETAVLRVWRNPVCAGSRGIILYTFSELRLDHTKDVLGFCHCEAAGWIFLHVVESFTCFTRTVSEDTPSRYGRWHI